MQIASGLDDPFAAHWPRLEYVLKGIKRDQAEKGTKSVPRLPVTPLILRKLKAVWDCSALDPLAFFGFLRCGEMTVPSDSTYDSSTHLNVSDVAVPLHQFAKCI